ncbi:MAG TPA: alanine--tRNA ligase, partial [Candidatus Polarisedimenticolia bacterium]|nr:alanine--tRNA ligase [Candidatus Polarisedimenticolia bacterium]
MIHRAQTGAEIRESFLAFFEERGHQRVASSSLIPAQDPTLLFTNAGMNQFKGVFLGAETRPYRRAATSQKCLRVSGKHNDLEQVGRTPRHHTFFEMLGNFSFGDYFKEEAIAYAWELLTSVYGIPKAKLFATVYQDDEEAYALWARIVPASRIARLGEKDNFWSMGDTGPCGPCSEIHYELDEPADCGRKACDPGHDCGRFMELWNLVFMQHDRQADGRLAPLERTGVDTGMGLERISAVLQGVKSNFDTDLLRPLVQAVEALAVERGGTPASDDPKARRVALQVIADHVRAMTFLMSDGVVPSNDGRGYVLRRIMRRAIRFGRALGVERPFLCDLSATVIEVMEAAYPELVAHGVMIADAARREEERFAETLAVGLQKVEALAQQLSVEKRRVIPGAEAFRLYDTFGVPPDLIRDVAQAWDFTVDETGFEAALSDQRERSRRGMKEATVAPPAVVQRLPARRSEFRGYEQTVVEDARILALVRNDTMVDELRAGDAGQVL